MRNIVYARDANGQVMAIYEREFNPNLSNNPSGNTCFDMVLIWPTMGYECDIKVCEPFVTFNAETNTLEFSDVYNIECSDPYNNKIYYSIPEGTIIPIAPVITEYKGEYHQINRSNSWKAKYDLDILVYDAGNNPVTLKLQQLSSSLTYADPNMLPKLAEWHVYGNEQQGRFLTKFPEVEPTYYGVDVSLDVQNNIFSRQLGKKAYELKDHLGNVRTTFSDIKMPTGNISQPFEVDLLSKFEYYPGGMSIFDLTYQTEVTRYGFNKGAEVDREIFSQKDRAFSTLFREGDTYTQRWWSQDPKRNDLPHQSPYSYMDANPIWKNDPLGDDPDFKFNSQQRVRDAKNLGTSVKALRDKEINGAYTPLTSFVLSLTPIIGDGIDIYDFGNELRQGNYLQAGLSGASFIPLADIVTKPLKVILKHSDEAKDISNSLDVVGNTGKKLHKNSNDYVGPQSVYEIEFDEFTKKYGKADASDINKSTGNPQRLEKQLRYWQKKQPESKVEGRVIEYFPSISTKNIKKIETNYIQKFYDKTGKLPELNQKHPGIISK